MVKRLLSELRADPRWCTEHLAFGFTPKFADVRRARASKIIELAKVYARLARLVVRHGRADLLIYPSGGPQAVPVIRDIFLLPAARLATKRLWVQFHAAGAADRLARGGVLSSGLRAAYRAVDGAIVMTGFNRSDPEALGIRCVEIIPHRIPDENPGGALPDFAARPLTVLHAGHLYDLKGTPQLVEAFARAAREHPSWRLVLMGEFLPPYSAESCLARCQELGILDRIEIAGVRHGAEKNSVFRRAHLFVFASVAPYESFGLVMAEAMMWGLPLLVTDWRGNRDVAGDAAVYCQPGADLAANLAAGLGSFMGSPGTWARAAAASRRRYESEFSGEGKAFREFVAREVGV